jgi:probable F420-dependent oxidoreductase
VIAAQHSAAILAKRVATLDALSGGRVRLGVGLGWQKEEYAAIGVPYRDRGRRLDENIEAMRALWGPGPSSYAGRHVAFERVHCDPKPARPEGVPILIGGSSEAAARRAGRLGNGFFPYVISPEDFASRLETLRAAAREAGRDPEAVELTVWPGSWDFSRGFDPDLARQYVDQGVSRLVISAGPGGRRHRPRSDTQADRHLPGRGDLEALSASRSTRASPRAREAMPRGPVREACGRKTPRTPTEVAIEGIGPYGRSVAVTWRSSQ